MAKIDEKATIKNIASHCKEYGFIYPSSDIYEGLGAAYDYGPNGVLLKNNLKDYWWKSMVQMNDNIVGIDASIFMHPTTWKASGHVDAFNDPMVDNKDSKKRYRADVLIEEQIAKIQNKIDKELAKAAKRFGETFDKEQYLTTNPRVVGYQEQISSIEQRMKSSIEEGDLDALKQLIVDLEIADPVSGSKNWTDVRQFNLMFSTEMGSLADGTNKIYLRPETAQGIFVNFLNVQKTSRMKPPFGIAQIGKAFRNEIIARQFIFRMREFEQMEMQFFVKPGEELEWYEYWKQKRINWHKALGLGEENYKFHDHLNLAHYANAATDIEFNFPMGFKELEGIHSRTDFDLTAHEKHSGKKLQYYDQQTNEAYTPYVVETSIGLDRLFLAVISSAYQEETLQDGSTRMVLKIPPAVAPYKAAILPLVNKDGLPEKAKEILDQLRFDHHLQFDVKDAIGRRYRRQDAIGTPYCITVDHDTLSDNSVTIRERDSMEQTRVAIEQLPEILSQKVSINPLLRAV
ncbi:MAG: glycyl-tRNA synthetase [Cyclobacteriaceae bacterium]|jgi:glycyl-tRNA synthetase